MLRTDTPPIDGTAFWALIDTGPIQLTYYDEASFWLQRPMFSDCESVSVEESEIEGWAMEPAPVYEAYRREQ